MKNKYLATLYKISVSMAYIDAESVEEVQEIIKDEDRASKFPWLFVPSAEFIQINVRNEENNG